MAIPRTLEEALCSESVGAEIMADNKSWSWLFRPLFINVGTIKMEIATSISCQFSNASSGLNYHCEDSDDTFNWSNDLFV